MAICIATRIFPKKFQSVVCFKSDAGFLIIIFIISCLLFFPSLKLLLVAFKLNDKTAATWFPYVSRKNESFLVSERFVNMQEGKGMAQ